MLSALSVILYGLAVLVSLLLIALILVQPSKSGGFGSAFGGLGESVFGAQAMSHLSKLTVAFITVFFVVTLLLAVVASHSKNEAAGSVITAEAENEAVAPDTVPEAAAVESVEVKTETVAAEAAPAEVKVEPAKVPEKK